MTITEFPIRATLVYPPLMVTFNEELKDIYTRQTRLSMVPRGGDLELSGEITDYRLTPQSVGQDAYAQQTRLTITVKVKYINNTDATQDKEQSFSAYRDFSTTSLLTDVQDELVKQISKELAELIFNATLDNW